MVKITSKRIVHYEADQFTQIMLGFGALVKPVDHTSDLVTNMQHVLTSPVVKYDGEGCFETLNTLYIPIRKS